MRLIRLAAATCSLLAWLPPATLATNPSERALCSKGLLTLAPVLQLEGSTLAFDADWARALRQQIRSLRYNATADQFDLPQELAECLGLAQASASRLESLDRSLLLLTALIDFTYYFGSEIHAMTRNQVLVNEDKHVVLFGEIERQFLAQLWPGKTTAPADPPTQARLNARFKTALEKSRVHPVFKDWLRHHAGLMDYYRLPRSEVFYALVAELHAAYR